jgi:two-component system KDP operon response regulator KdpE
MNDEQKKIILVADNEDDWRDLLAIVIRRSGYEVIEAKTGQEAIDRATRGNPNLILLDFGLPEINGHEVLAHLKMNAATRQIPVFFQVAGATAQGFRCPDGAQEVLYKPFDLGDLPAILAKYLPGRRVGIPPRSTKE